MDRLLEADAEVYIKKTHFPPDDQGLSMYIYVIYICVCARVCAFAAALLFLQCRGRLTMTQMF